MKHLHFVYRNHKKALAATKKCTQKLKYYIAEKLYYWETNWDDDVDVTPNIEINTALNIKAAIKNILESFCPEKEETIYLNHD